MKRTIFALFLATFLVAFINDANAQTQKGNIMVGGNLGNLDIGLKSGSNTTFTLNPKAGLFIKDGLAVGLEGMFGVAHIGGRSGNTINYGIGTFGRYYITDKNLEFVKHGKFFADANIGFQGQNQTKGGASTNGLGFGFGPGFAYFITPNVAIETAVKYQGIVGFGSDPYQHDIKWSLGFQIYLPCKSIKDKVKSDF